MPQGMPHQPGEPGFLHGGNKNLLVEGIPVPWFRGIDGRGEDPGGKENLPGFQIPENGKGSVVQGNVPCLSRLGDGNSENPLGCVDVLPPEIELFGLSKSRMDGELYIRPELGREDLFQFGFVRFGEKDRPALRFLEELDVLDGILLDQAVPESDVEDVFEKGVVAIDCILCQPSLFHESRLYAL